MNHKAIYALYSNVVRVEESNEIVRCFDINKNEVIIDEAAVNAWVDPDGYKYSRVKEYPSIGDQLDMIYHAGLGGDEFQAAIAAIKTKYPKPE